MLAVGNLPLEKAESVHGKGLFLIHRFHHRDLLHLDLDGAEEEWRWDSQLQVGFFPEEGSVRPLWLASWSSSVATRWNRKEIKSVTLPPKTESTPTDEAMTLLDWRRLYSLGRRDMTTVEANASTRLARAFKRGQLALLMRGFMKLAIWALGKVSKGMSYSPAVLGGIPLGLKSRRHNH